MYELIATVLSSAWSIALPFGFSFGAFILFVWSFPLVVRFIKSIF